MDSLSSSMIRIEIPSLGVCVSVGEKSQGYGNLVFAIDEEEIQLQSLEIASFVNTLQSYCYAIAVHGVYGTSYVNETDVNIGFSCQCEGFSNFYIFEGETNIFSRVGVSNLLMFREIGDFVRKIHDISKFAGMDIGPINKPEIYFAFM